MKRKLIRQGKSAVTITLPSKWVAFHDLKPGAEVEVLQKGDSIIVESTQKATQKTTAITLKSDNPWYVSQALRSIYFSNYEEVKIHFTSRTAMKAIQDAVETLLGFEIVDYTDSHCTIRNLAKPVDTEFSSLLRRIFHLTFSYVERQILDAPLEDQAEDEIARIKKFSFYGRKIIANEMIFNQRISRAYYMLLQNMAIILNNCHYTTESIVQSKAILSSPTKRYIQEMLALYKMFSESLFRQEADKLHIINEQRVQLINKKLSDLFGKVSPQERILLHYTGDSIRVICTSTALLFTILYDNPKSDER